MLSHLQKSKIFVEKTTTKQIDSGSKHDKNDNGYHLICFCPPSAEGPKGWLHKK